MQRNQQWSGIITNASPFLLPPGSLQEQVNLHCRKPGCLESRGGMKLVSPSMTGQGNRVMDVFTYPRTQSSTLLQLLPSGQLVTLELPTVSTSTQTGYEPNLATGPLETETNYLWQYQTDGGNTYDLVYVFEGGNANQHSWQYIVEEANACNSPVTDIDAGDAPPERVVGVDPDDLCDK